MIQRAISVTLAAALTFNATAAGLVPLFGSATDFAEQIGRQASHRARPKPGPVYRGPNPSRDPLRNKIWTPKLLEALRQKRADDAMESAILRGELFASMTPLEVAALYLVQGAGGSGSGGGYEGETGAPGGGGGTPGQGGGGTGTGGGTGGSTGGGTPGLGGSGGAGEGGATTSGRGMVAGVNTNTGNRLATIPIVGWTARGNIGVDFTLYHNSISEYDGVFGHNWSHSYDMKLHEAVTTAGTIVTVQMPDGLEVPYALTSGTYTPPAGFNYDLVKHSNGTWTMTRKDRGTYQFSSAGKLSAITDRNANAISITRNTNGTIASVSAVDGRQLVFSYDANNRVSEVEDPIGRIWGFEYDANGDLVTIEHPELDGQVPEQTFTYNSNHAMLTEVDLMGETWSWSYHTDGKVETTTDPLNRVKTFTYSGSSTTITYPNAETEVHNYSSGLLASRVDEMGYSEAYEYDSDRNQIKRTDANGKIWLYTWDAKANLLTAKNPLNHIWTLTYLSTNELKTVKDPLNNTTTYFHDSAGNVTHYTDPLGRTPVTITYDSFGQPERVTDSIGRETEYAYNLRGEVISVTDPAELVTQYGYDDLSVAIAVTDSTGLKTEIYYDAWRRPFSTIIGGSIESSVTYNRRNQVLTATDEMGRESQATYDDAGQLVTSTNPRGDTQTLFYDTVGRVWKVRNGNAKDRIYEYSDRGQVTKLTMPDGTYEEWGYDANGNTTSYKNGLGQITQYGYDFAGRNTLVDYPTGTTDTEFTYDAAGRRTGMTDATGLTTWNFDVAGQLHELIQPQGTLTYGYNAVGQRISQSGAGQSQTWSFDNTTGRLMSMTNGFNETTTLAYDAFGRVSRKTLSSGQYEEYTYDALHRVSQIALKNSANTVLRTQSYTYDASSKIMSHTVGGVTTNYGYDLAGQLISETRTGYSGAYTYDANGNRLTRTVNGVQEVYAYDDGDKLLDVKIGGVAVKEFEYDLAGRTKEITTSAGTTIFTYDHESRAVTLSGPGMVQTNVYNGLDTRVGSTTNSVANTYLRNGAYVTAPVIKDSNATFTPGVSERRGTTTTFSHSGLKNADAQTGVNQVVNATQQYDAFGNLASSTGTWQGQFGYGGGFGYQQDATGLKLLGHRYYDSSTGRFLTRDPIKDGRNWYVYCAGDPVGFGDPEGLITTTVVTLIANRYLINPPGADVMDNIRKTQAISASVIIPDTAYMLPEAGAHDYATPRVIQIATWIGRVKPGGEWDYKAKFKNSVYDDFGNFNYGATGAALGFPLWMLKWPGGPDQFAARTWRSEWGFPLWPPGSGDDPQDQKMIEAGFRFYEWQFARQ